MVALAAGVLLVLSTLVEMGRQVQNEIDRLASANADSAQWSISQAEVELLALALAIEQAAPGDAAALDDLRRRFDIFYSRVTILETSPIFAAVRADPEAFAALIRLDAFLASAVRAIDGDDATLEAALPALAAGADAAREDVRTVSLTGVAVLAEVADGQRISVASTLARVANLTGALFLVMVILLMLLAYFVRKERRNALAEGQTRARLASIIATSLDAVLVADDEGRVLEFNGAAEQIFGYTRAEAVGTPMDELIVPDHHRAAHAAGMRRYLATGEKRVIGKGRIRLEARRKSGEVFPVELSVSTAATRDGEVFISFLRDISHRVAAERELIKARDEAVAGEKAKAELIAVMSHEMRTPLNGMLGTLDLLDGTERPPKDRQYLDMIRTSGRQLLYHVDTVLEISRAEAGKIILANEAFSLPAFLNELVEGQRGLAASRGNQLSHRLAGNGLDRVVGDQARLRQVLLNLVSNAIKFTRNGTISVEAERLPDTGMIEFRVIDDGIGIDGADLERVFEDFVTLDTSYSRAVGGTGLGLGIVRRLVTAMGGEIAVESARGAGSTFRLRLPLPAASDRGGEAGEPAAPLVAPVPEVAPARPMKVLIVEDNQINRVVLRDMLEQDGHTVDEAHDGQQGVEKVARASYDIVLMDISMPVLDGVSATRAIRQTEARGTCLPIVALTAHASSADKERFRAAGVDDILVKPISRQALRVVLAALAPSPPQPAPAAPPRPLSPPQSAPQSPSPDLIDAEQIEDLAEALGPEKFAELMTAFRHETAEAVASIAQRLEQGETGADLADAVHHTSGSAAVFGARALRSELAALETLLRDGGTPDPATPTRLRACWAETEAVLLAPLDRA
ncbi:MAG: ATP-binding protein [Roseicyclus sp.]|nr:ATP-binding protein [Roseicyclus sp.]